MAKRKGKPEQQPDVDPAAAERREILRRAKAGDESVVPAVRRMLLEDRDLLAKLGGDFARDAERKFVESLTGKSVGTREAILHRLAQLREELQGANPTPLERLLVERVVVAWMHAQFADFTAGHYERPGAEVSTAFLEFTQRTQDRATRRFLASLRTLALVRKLALPRLRVIVNGAAEAPKLVEQKGA